MSVVRKPDWKLGLVAGLSFTVGLFVLNAFERHDAISFIAFAMSMVAAWVIFSWLLRRGARGG